MFLDDVEVSGAACCDGPISSTTPAKLNAKTAPLPNASPSQDWTGPCYYPCGWSEGMRTDHLWGSKMKPQPSLTLSISRF